MIDVSLRTRAMVTDAADWNTDEVRRPLWHHYAKKCYLCERNLDLSEFEIDHRMPQGRFAQFIHCWMNLFPACRSCNIRRPDYPDRGILLSPGITPRLESRLLQRIERVSATEIRARFSATDPLDENAANTAHELEPIHSPASGTTDTAKQRAFDLLDAIVDHYNRKIYPLAYDVLRARRRQRPDADKEAQLVESLRRNQPFTMLMHSLVEEHAPDLRDLLDRALND